MKIIEFIKGRGASPSGNSGPIRRGIRIITTITIRTIIIILIITIIIVIIIIIIIIITIRIHFLE